VIEYLQADGGAHLNLNWALEGTQPSQPPTLTLTSASGRTAVLSWTSVDGASTYSLKRGTALGGPYPAVIPVSGTGTSDTVSADGDYYYV
jgi:cellulose 1,4-beta-cellobiosidase